VHLTHTELGGRFTIRMVVGQRQTQRSHVEEAWGLIRREAEALAVSR
jgi:aromatic-L-amino-acid/L-tryptophan decarboxylase